MLVYIWSRRNPNVRMNFFGLLNFQAPFLPWVLMGFSLLLGNSIIVDLLGGDLSDLLTCLVLTLALTIISLFLFIIYYILRWWSTFLYNNELSCCWYYMFCLSISGIAVGHVYYFLEDVFPNQPGGGRWLRTPSILWVHYNVSGLHNVKGLWSIQGNWCIHNQS